MALADLTLPPDPATTPEWDPGLDASSPLRPHLALYLFRMELMTIISELQNWKRLS